MTATHLTRPERVRLGWIAGSKPAKVSAPMAEAAGTSGSGRRPSSPASLGLTGRRSRRPARALAPLALACLAAVASLAADPAPDAAVKKPDWTGLDALIVAGDYEQAAAAAAEIAETVRPKRRDNDFLPRSLDWIQALMRRGFAELRLGRLDAADEALEEAYRAFKDRDVQRLLSVQARAADARTREMLVRVDIGWVELLDLRMAVILERLRFASLELAGGPRAADREAALREQVGEWLDDFEVLARNAREARETLAGRIELGGTGVLASPHARAVAGRFRPALAAGIESLELSRLPFGDPRTKADGSEAATEALPARERLAESFAQFAAAATALDEAIAAAAPKGVATMKPDARIEAALLRESLLGAEAMALLEAGKPADCRARLAEVMALRREAATLRKLPRPDEHPDLFWPLLITADTIIQESRARLEAGDPAGSRAASLEAGKLLARADALAVPREHPLRQQLERVRGNLAATLTAVEARIPGSEAANAAASRLRRAIDATAAAGVDY